jgi:uncharacterized surface anchored protein
MKEWIKKSMSLLLVAVMVLTSSGVTNIVEVVAAGSDGVSVSNDDSDMTYKVQIVKSGHGNVGFSGTEANSKRMSPGSTVSLFVQADNGYELKSLVDQVTGEVIWTGDASEVTVTVPDHDFYIQPSFGKATVKQSGSSNGSSSDGSVSNSNGGSGISSDSGGISNGESSTGDVTSNSSGNGQDESSADISVSTSSDTADTGIVVENNEAKKSDDEKKSDEAKKEEDKKEEDKKEEDTSAKEETKTVLADTENADQYDLKDFESKRLVLLTNDKNVIIDQEHIIGEYDNIYLLQYESDTDARKYYSYYVSKALAVEPDKTIETADAPELLTEDASDLPVIEMTDEENAVDSAAEAEEKTDETSVGNIIALIDTGVSEYKNVVESVSLIDDKLYGGEHADHMLSALLSQNDNASVLSVRALNDNGYGTVSSIVAGVEYAMNRGAKYINLSLYAKKTLSNSILEAKLNEAVDSGIIVSGAAGNAGEDVKDYIPGSFEKPYIIGASDENGNRLSISNYGDTVDYYVVANSTSEATALFTGYVSANGIENLENFSLLHPFVNEAGDTGIEIPDISKEESDNAILDPSIEEYVKSNLNSDYVNMDQFNLTGSMKVVHALADASAVNKNTTIHDVVGVDGECSHAFLFGLTSYVAVYDVDSTSDYYVAYANTMQQNAMSEVLDYVVAWNSTDGFYTTDVHYDDDTGLLYVPKAAYNTSDGQHVMDALQAEFLQKVYTDEDFQVAGFVPHSVDDGSNVDVSGNVLDGVDICSTLHINPDLDMSSMVVSMNGIPLDDEEWDYNSETGILYLYYSSLGVEHVHVSADGYDTNQDFKSADIDANGIAGPTYTYGQMEAINDKNHPAKADIEALKQRLVYYGNIVTMQFSEANKPLGSGEIAAYMPVPPGIEEGDHVGDDWPSRNGAKLIKYITGWDVSDIVNSTKVWEGMHQSSNQVRMGYWVTYPKETNLTQYVDFPPAGSGPSDWDPDGEYGAHHALSKSPIDFSSLPDNTKKLRSTCIELKVADDEVSQGKWDYIENTFPGIFKREDQIGSSPERTNVMERPLRVVESGDDTYVVMAYVTQRDGQQCSYGIYKVWVKDPAGKLEIWKVIKPDDGVLNEGEGKIDLAGFVFHIHGTSEDGETVDIDTDPTDASGHTVVEKVPIPDSNGYTITEPTVDGQPINTGVWADVQLTNIQVKDGETTSVTFENRRRLGSIQIIKEIFNQTDEGHLNKDGFLFEVTGTTIDGKELIRRTRGTMHNGTIIITDLPFSSPEGYLVTEVTPSNGTWVTQYWDDQNYQHTSTDHRVHVNREGNVPYNDYSPNDATIYITNTMEYGHIRVYKTIIDPTHMMTDDELRDQLRRVKFYVSSNNTENVAWAQVRIPESGAENVVTITEGPADGQITGYVEFHDLPVGTYTVTEDVSGVPDFHKYWTADKRSDIVKVTKDHTTVAPREVHFTNRLRTGNLKIKKYTNHPDYNGTNVTVPDYWEQGFVFKIDAGDLIYSGYLNTDPDMNEYDATSAPVSGIHWYGDRVYPRSAGPVITNEQGEWLVENIPVGTYTIQEVDVPDWWSNFDFTMNHSPLTAVVSENTTTTFEVYNNFDVGDLEVKKSIPDNVPEDYRDCVGWVYHLEGRSLSGQSINIDEPTGSDGVAHFTNIPVSDENGYTVTELRTPYQQSGTLLDEIWECTPVTEGAHGVGRVYQNVQIRKDDVTKLEFRNRPRTGKVRVEKYIQNLTSVADLDVLRDGVAFEISGTTKAGKDYSAVAITENGFALFDDVPVGHYTVKEKAMSNSVSVNNVPVSWTLADIQEIDVEDNKTANAVMINNVNPMHLIAEKEVAGNNQQTRKDGFVFKATGTLEGFDEAHRTVIFTKTTGADGIADFGQVPLGNYIVEEVGTPAWYEFSGGQNYECTLYDKGQTVKLHFKNTWVTGSIRVEKVTHQQTSENRSGFVFHCEGKYQSGVDSNGQPVYTSYVAEDKTTGRDGIVTFTDLPVGTYTVTEVGSEGAYIPPGKPAHWWALDAEDVELARNVDVTSGDPIDVKFENTYKRGNVHIKKKVIDPTGKWKKNRNGDPSAEGFEFSIVGTAESGEEVNERVTTNEFGDATFTNIPIGDNYVVSEIRSADSDVGISDKWDTDPNPARFEGVQVTATDDGLPITTDLELQGHTFKNTYTYGHLVVQKNVHDDYHPQYGQPIISPDDFTFKITSLDNPGLTYTETTKDGGYATFGNIPAGEYQLEEIATPDGGGGIGAWWTTSAPKIVTIQYDRENDVPVTTHEQMDNFYQTSKVVVHKRVNDKSYNKQFYNADGTVKVDGYVFLLHGFSDSGEQVQEWGVTTEDGSYSWTNIPIGNYNVTEVTGVGLFEPVANQGPTSYWNIDPLNEQVRVDNESVAEVTVTNTFKTGGLDVVKWVHPNTDNANVVDNIIKEGFQFRLHGKSIAGEYGEIEDVDVLATTGPDGIAHFTHIPIGTYTLSEVGSENQDIDISEWWTPAPDQTVTVYWEGPNEEIQPNRVSMINSMDIGSVKVKKVVTDPSNKRPDLSNFKFKLSGVTESGVELTPLIGFTDEKGELIFENIPVGAHYKVEEVATPNSDGIGSEWDVIQPEKIDVIVNKDDVTELTFENIHKTGSLIVHKDVKNESYKGMSTNESDEPLVSPKNFKFEIIGLDENGDEDASLRYTAYSNESGDAFFEDIPVGRYKVSEIESPDGHGSVGYWWTVEGNDAEVEVTYNTDIHDEDVPKVTINNEYKVGELVVQKELTDKSKHNKTLSDFVFYLTGKSSSGQTVRLWATTDGEGQAKFVNVPIGTYDLTEVSILGETDQSIFIGSDSYWDIEPRYQRVTIEDGETSEAEPVTVTNNFKTGNLDVVKWVHPNTDNQNVVDNIPKSGFQFRLRGKSLAGKAGLIEDIDLIAETDEEGVAHFTNVPIGTYTLSEIGTDNHDIDVSSWWTPAENQTVTVLWEGPEGNFEPNRVSMINNMDVGSIKIQKTVTDPSGKRSDLRNFKFELTGETESGIELTPLTAVTDEHGVCTFTNIPVGSHYTVREVATPDSNNVSDEWDVVQVEQVDVKVVKNGVTPLEFENIHKTGSLIVHKDVINESYKGMAVNQSDAPLLSPQDFRFEIIGLNEDGTEDLSLRYTAYTDEHGDALFKDIPVGKYKVSEIESPDGHGSVGYWWTTTIDNDVVDVTYDKYTHEEDVPKVTVTNEYQVGKLVVQKEIKDKSELAKSKSGFVFYLTGTSSAGQTVRLWNTTNGEGKAEFINVPVGTYDLTEVSAEGSTDQLFYTNPSSYWAMEPLHQEVTIRNGETEEATAATVTNTFKTGNLDVYKWVNPNTDNENVVANMPKAGFQFRLHGKSIAGNDDVIPDVDVVAITGADGIAHFTNIPVGTYLLSEIGTDNQDGHISSWWTAAPDQSVSIQWEGQNGEIAPNRVSMVNDLNVGVIKIKKVVTDPSGKRTDLRNFKFSLNGITESGIELTEMTAVTDKNGECVFANVPVGAHYIVEEIATPDSEGIGDEWDVVQPKRTDVEVKKGAVTELTFENIHKTGSLIVHKDIVNESYKGMNDNESDAPLVNPKNFRFEIVGLNEDGTPDESLRYTQFSNDDGDAIFTKLPIGKYKVSEIETPDGHGTVGYWWTVTGNDAVVDVTYDKYTHEEDVPKVTIKNEYQVGELIVQKELEDNTVPNQNTTLSDFVFYLTGTSSSGKEVRLWAKTDGEGKARFMNVPIGTYGLTEVSALGNTDQLVFAGPESYWQVEPRYQRVTIEDGKTGEVASANVKNVYKSGKAIVKKVIKNDSRYPDPSLAGFTFELTGHSFGNDADFNDVNHVLATTDTGGIAVFENIPVGTEFTLKEVLTDENNENKLDERVWVVPDERQVTITQNEMPYYEMVNIYKLGNVKVKKIIDDPSRLMNDRLDGFQFHLYGTSYGGSNVDETARTDHNGEILFENIPVGEYTLEETASPDRDDMDPRWTSNGLKQTVVVKYNETVEKEFTNTFETGNLIITKELKNDSEFGPHDMDGFTFRLTRLTETGELDERYVYEAKTGDKTCQQTLLSNGSVVHVDSTETGVSPCTIVGKNVVKRYQAAFANIPVGRYKFTEVDTPEITSYGVGEWWSVTTDPIDGIVEIEHDDETNDPITKHVTVKNVYKVGNVEVHKDVTDPSNTYKTKAGFTFKLEGTSASGEHVVLTAETDGDGKAVFDNVPIGTHYMITEQNVFDEAEDITNAGPDYYWDIQPRKQYVDVMENVTTGVGGDVRINNIYKTGDLTVEKVIDNPALNHDTPYGVSGKNGFRFRLHGKSWKNEQFDYEDIDRYATTGEDWITYGTNWEVTTHDGDEGKAHFAGIPIGVYTLEEVNVVDFGEEITSLAPTWWETALPRTINITYGDVKTISMTNRYKTGDLEIKKTVEDPSKLAESLEGFWFKLEGVSESGVSVTEVEQTNKYGIAQFEDIPVGKNYKVTEIGTPEDDTNIPSWWDATDNKEGRGRSVEIIDKKVISSGEQEIPVEEFKNVYKTGNIKVQKIVRESSFNSDLGKQYFAFRLTGTSDSGKEIEKYGITDENGEYTFENIPVGSDYTITEVDKKTVQDAAIAGNIEARKIAHLPIHNLDGFVTPQSVQGIVVDYNAEKHEQKDTKVSFTNEYTKVMINVMDYMTDVELDDVYLRIRDTETGNTIYYSLRTFNKDNTSYNINDKLLYGLVPGRTYTVEEVRPRPGYDYTLYTKDGFISEYATAGSAAFGSGVFNDEVFEGVELQPVASVDPPNEATFTVLDQSGIQVVSLFNKPVYSKLTTRKEGEVMSAHIVDNELTKYRYVIKGLPNAEYEVRAAEDIKYLDGYTYYPIHEKGEVLAHLTTDENGEATTDPLYLGKYEIEELKAPRGYYLDESTKIQTIDLYDSYLKSNYNPGQVQKELYGEDVVGDSVTFYNERQAVDIGNDPDPGDIPFDDPRDPLQDNYLHAGVYKYGVDGVTEVPVAGAEFTLYAEEDIIDVYGNVTIPKDTKIEVAYSGDDGRAQFKTDLPVGKYYVKETNAPHGYYSSTAVVHYDTTNYENNDEVEFIRMTGEIRNGITTVRVFLKDDLTLNELADASLKLVDSKGNLVEAWITTNTDGTGYVIKGLDPGEEYTLKEIIPRDGYTKNIIIPEDMKDKLTPVGTDAVKFTVPDKDVDENLTNMPEDYEVTILNRYITGSVTVSKEGKILKTAQNLHSERTFIGQVIDWAKTVFGFGTEGTEGVEFTVYAAEDIYHPDGVTGLLYHKDEPVKIKVRTDNLDAILSTDSTGKVIFDGMHLGRFYVRETSHPEGYITNYEAKPFVLAVKDYVTDEVWASTDVEYMNTRQKVNIKVDKADMADHTKVLAGAVFGLYTEDDIKTRDGQILLPKNTLIETQVTDSEGIAEFTADLPLGRYYIKEEAAPAGYAMNYSEVYVDASWVENGPEVLKFYYHFYDEPSEIYVDKLENVTGKHLRNVELAIYKGTKEVDHWVTTGTAHVSRGLTIGETYVLKELNPPAGYVTAPDVTFTVEDLKDTIQHVVMKDDPTQIEVQTWAVNKNGKEEELPGVKMHLETPNGEVVVVDNEDIRWTSEQLPTHWDKILVGSYVIVIDSVPEGFVKPKPVKIQVKDIKDLQHFDVKVPTVNVDVTAVDHTTGDPLDGVVVTVYDEDKQPVYEHVDLKFVKDKVPVGFYYIQVEHVPDGYVIPPLFDMIVNETSETQYFVIPIDQTNIVINAADSKNNKPVEDVNVTVYDENGNPVRENVPLEYATTGITPGTYIIHVNSVPEGYLMPTEDTTIVIENKTEKQVFTIPIDPIDIFIKAIDKDTGEDMNNNVYVTIYDKQGMVVFNNVPLSYAEDHAQPGEYTIRVDEVPEGYVIPDAITMNVQKVRGTQTFIVPVGHIKTAYEVLDKKTGKEISGVMMNLVDADGKTYATWTSKNGWHNIDKVPAGDYKIVVTSVPSGYAIPAAKSIKIRSIEDLQKFIIKLDKATDSDNGKSNKKKSDKDGSSKKSNSKKKSGNGTSKFSRSSGGGSNTSTSAAKTSDMLILIMFGAIFVFALSFVFRKNKKTDVNDKSE